MWVKMYYLKLLQRSVLKVILSFYTMKEPEYREENGRLMTVIAEITLLGCYAI
jgi:hypothetical protein